MPWGSHLWLCMSASSPFLAVIHFFALDMIQSIMGFCYTWLFKA